MFKISKNIEIKNRNFYILCIIRFFQGLIFFVPVQTLFYQSREIKLDQIYILEAILLGSIILFEIPWGWIADRTSYKTTLIISNGISALTLLMMYKFYGFEAFAIMMLIKGIGLAGRSGCDTALLYESISEKNGEEAFGIWQGFAIGGIMISSLLSGFVTKISIDLTVLLTVFTYTIAFVLCFLLKKDIKKEEDKEKINLKNAFKDIIDLKKMLIFILGISLFIEITSIVVVYLNQLQYSRCNINVEYFGIIVGLGQILGLFSFKINKLTKKFGNKRVILGLIITLIISLMLLIGTTNGVISVLTILFIEASSYMIYPIVTDIENKLMKKDSKNRATILSIYSVIGSIIAVGVNIIISLFADNSLIGSLIICLVLGVISLIIVFFTDSKFINRKYMVK